MSYLLIAFVVLMALSPLISALPSRRQRLIADLRQAAVMAGLYVQLKQSPAEDSDAPVTAYYGCRRNREDGRAPANVVYRRTEQGWSALQGRWPDAKLDLLSRLPAGVSAACEDFGGVGVYWNEEGERADVEVLADVLKVLLGREAAAKN